MLVFFQGKVKYESHKSKVWVIQSRTTFSHFLSFWIWSRLCAMLYCVSVIVTQENSELSCKYPCSLHQLSWTKKKKKLKKPLSFGIPSQLMSDPTGSVSPHTLLWFLSLSWHIFVYPGVNSRNQFNFYGLSLVFC